MSYISKVFNVMIASPGDVASERTIIRDVIYEWNAVHSESRNIVLMPIGWESHSSPEMGGSPQDIINKQVLDKKSKNILQPTNLQCFTSQANLLRWTL